MFLFCAALDPEFSQTEANYAYLPIYRYTHTCMYTYTHNTSVAHRTADQFLKFSRRRSLIAHQHKDGMWLLPIMGIVKFMK